MYYQELTEYEIIKTRSIIRFTVIFDELLQRSLSLHQQYVSLKMKRKKVKMMWNFLSFYRQPVT